MSDRKKLESSFKNMVLALSIISLLSAFAIGFTYAKTQPVAEKMKREKFENAVKEVVPVFDKLSEKYSVDDLTLYTAYKNGKIVGTAAETFSDKGFGGRIKLMVGFDAEGKIFNSSILEMKETPGLGSKIAAPKFKDQINGKDPDKYRLKVKKDGGDVDAVTAATISSRAFCDAVQKAAAAYKKGGKK